MNPLEAQRLANVAEKERLLAELNLRYGPITTTAKSTKKTNGQPVKKRKVSVAAIPTRSSARIRTTPQKPSYTEAKVAPNLRSKPTAKRGPMKEKSAAVVKNDVEVQTVIPPNIEEIRRGWTNWEPDGPSPTRGDDGTFHFDDFPTFHPNKSPEEMIREGSFGGSYWRPLRSKRLGITIQDDWRELPSDWVSGLSVSQYLASSTYDPDVNKYKVSCGQSIEEWEAAGWIAHDFDVRGWFQWYCRFYLGRRCADDARQVSRWSKCVGPSGRWKRMLMKAYRRQGVRDVFDDGEDEEANDVSPVMHQTCHHWAYEIKQRDLDEIWQTSPA